MGNWTGQVLKATTSTTVGVGSLENPSSSTRRLLVMEFIVGSDAATLGTSNFRWELNRSTSTATGTSITPQALDLSDTSTTALIKSNLSANGTLTSGAIMETLAIAEQVTFRWVAPPGSPIIIPAVANNGIHWMTPVCGNTPSAAVQITFMD